MLLIFKLFCIIKDGTKEDKNKNSESLEDQTKNQEVESTGQLSDKQKIISKKNHSKTAVKQSSLFVNIAFLLLHFVVFLILFKVIRRLSF